MKRITSYSLHTLLFIFLVGLFSCTKDQLLEIKNTEPPLIYITGVVEGAIIFNSTNVKIDKINKTFTGSLGINRSGVQDKEAFSVNFSVDTTNLPKGTVGLKPSDYKLYIAEADKSLPSKIEIASGQTSAPLTLWVSKTVLDANQGKKLAINIVIANPTKYQVHPTLSKTTIIVDVPTFAEKAIDVTTTYIVNPGGDPVFQRNDNPSSRFGILKGWTTSSSILNMDNFTKGGYDSYNGGAYMSMDTWWAPNIPNGKIYQTISLPIGKYTFSMDFESQGIGDENYIAVTKGNILPDVANIATAIASANLFVSKINFLLPEQTTVSIGVVVNLVHGFQGFRARGVKLLRYDSPFN